MTTNRIQPGRSAGRRTMSSCAIALALGVFVSPTQAQQQVAELAFNSTSPDLLGDWGGERTRLASEGVFLFFDYDGQAVHNLSGGDSQLTRLANQWVFGASLDFDKLFAWKGASFDVMVTNRSGRDLSEDAKLGADYGVVNNYGIAETWWLTEFALDQKFLNDKIEWRIGRTSAGTDFNKTDLCDFMNLVYCGTPFTNVTSYSTFFNMGRFGTSIKVFSSKDDYFSIGAYQVNPKYYDPSWAVAHGLSFDIPSGTTGWMYPVQYEWAGKMAGMPGTYQVGAWYSTAPISDLFFDAKHQPLGVSGLPALERRGDYGAYIDVDQRLTDDNGKGLSLFLNMVQSNPQTEAIDREVNIGLKYHEPFERPNDYIGVGVGAYLNNDRLYKTFVAQHGTDYDAVAQAFVGHGYEYHLEAFYKWSVLRSVQLMPDIQYIYHPGASSRNDDVFVLGLTTQISF